MVPPFPLFVPFLLARKQQEFTFFGQINARLGMVNRNEMKHGMVVVEDTASNRVVGFLEIGMLPPPSQYEQQSLATSALPDTVEVENANPKSSSSDDSGSTGGLWAAAEAAAEAPSRIFFSKKKVNVISAGEDSAGDVGAAEDDDKRRRQRIKQRREQRPDAAYLANVVVDKNQRRRGIGRMMVTSAVEITRALWPDEKSLYVTVEQVRSIVIAYTCAANKTVWNWNFGRPAEVKAIAEVVPDVSINLNYSHGIDSMICDELL